MRSRYPIALIGILTGVTIVASSAPAFASSAQAETTVEVVVADGAQVGGNVFYDNTFTVQY